jgi:methanogenic corrinoid protein MtbC1
MQSESKSEADREVCMTKHFTSFEDGAVDIAKFFEQPPEIAADSAGPDAGAWRDLLGDVIAQDILPRLLKTRGESGSAWETMAHDAPNAAVIAAFVELIIDDDVEQLRAVADRVILHTGGRDALLKELLTPAARLLGRMWEEDACDFMTVTLGVHRLNQIMKETEAAAAEPAFSRSFDHRILLLPAPGEQHSFGLTMVADSFRAAGWCVRSAPAASRGQLLRLVKDEWFDVVGLSVSTERSLKGLPACIRALRAASCNPRRFVMLGGNAINCHPERARFLGADGVAEDAGAAVQLADNYMETTVTGRFCQFITKPVDAGRSL